MAGDHRSPGANVVNVLLSFGVIEISTFAPLKKTGAPPTRWNARTGEFTPPGRMSEACENRVSEFLVMEIQLILIRSLVSLSASAKGGC